MILDINDPNFDPIKLYKSYMKRRRYYLREWEDANFHPPDYHTMIEWIYHNYHNLPKYYFKDAIGYGHKTEQIIKISRQLMIIWKESGLLK